MTATAKPKRKPKATATASRTEKRPRHRALAPALAAACALALGAAAGCGGGQPPGTPGPEASEAPEASEPRSPGPSTPSTPTTPKTPQPKTTEEPSTPDKATTKTSPFTGLPGTPGQVLAVKFDNASKARPHTGLDKADIVYVEKVEYGLSRLMGVYATGAEAERPASVGPVRSVRESDVELLRQFGRPALAYSGVRSALKEFLSKAPIEARPNGETRGAYFRDTSRPAPHNLYVRPDAVLKSAPNASRAADIGFCFDDEAPEGGTPAAERTVRYRSASHTFRWAPSTERWQVSFDGAPARDTGGKQLSAPTIVIQHVDMPLSKYKDVNGEATPYINTVGSGDATVLRDGKAYETKWQRPTAESGTTFTQRNNGERMPFAPGQVWVVYADR
ncbi:DUF3048 domain-containing protein [Streptomyces apocyni]|uniref:DUF3048 domain-containing protein n=1 Tax=Streptomyces apocyni TaxID=2654677 RepID=UPI0012EA2C1B|nr:DUF3048 domain-containing protein [Streptomyces apocyni]